MIKQACAALVALLPLSTAAAQETRMPAWMAGCWEVRDGERWTEECWTVPRAGMMMGSGRSGTDATVRSWEVMRIEAGEGGVLAFVAAPGGQGWTRFEAATDPGEGVTFVNPDHDFPQRVRYWREDGLLNAEVSLEDGTQAMRWSFARMGN